MNKDMTPRQMLLAKQDEVIMKLVWMKFEIELTMKANDVLLGNSKKGVSIAQLEVTN